MNKQVKPLIRNPIKTSTISMNKDLKQWVSEEEQSEIIKAMRTKFKDKKPKGKCNICRVHPAKFICI